MKRKKWMAFLLVLVLCFASVPMSKISVDAASSKYWIAVNKQANVATVYQKKDGNWVPIKAMLISCGGGKTPSGTYHTTEKLRWHELVEQTYGQYCTRIVGHILFHSVWYHYNYNKQSMDVNEFNKLGKTASHGCVRLSVKDSKWIYDHCSIGTKVTIYKNSDPGPLGKPAPYKMPASAGKKNWDPTDKSDKNPYYQTCPVLSQKVKNIAYGDNNYKTTKSLVKAKQKNGKSLKSLKVSVKKYKKASKKYIKATYSNTVPGKYMITYKATGSKGVSLTKTFLFKVAKAKEN